jgi:hypothetical protein
MPVSLRFHSPAFIELGRRLGGAAHHEGVEVRHDLVDPGAFLRRELMDLQPGLLEQGEAGGVEGVGDQNPVHGRSQLSAGRRSGDSFRG